ncbi:MAG: hypothetical protein L7F78_07440, partial [Syntrophales bacterium LBB04]|nr:hypothetical protein [Syntrophales bacterium LBB04]
MDNLVDFKRRCIPERFSIQKRGAVTSETMLHDLGDYIQYLYAADKIAGGGYKNQVMEILSWALEQHPFRKSLSTRKGIFRSTVDSGDFLVGLCCMLHADVDEKVKARFIEAIDRNIEEFYHDGMGSLSRLSFMKIRLPIVYWYSLFNDIEELVYIYEFIGKQKYLSTAIELYREATSYKVGNIPTIGSFLDRGVNALLKRSKLNLYRTVLSKTMSNFCSASIRIAPYCKDVNIRGDVLEPLIQSFWDPKEGKFATFASRFDPEEYTLGQNHPALSLFVDYDLPDFFGHIAVIESFIRELGDFPRQFFHRSSFHVDSIIDFGTLLIKLWVRTGNEKYLRTAEGYLHKVRDRCRTDFGYVIQGDERGRQWEYHTKFQSLLMKPYILACEIAEGKDIFKDRFLFLLSRDRLAISPVQSTNDRNRMKFVL